jgi:hypothetical protein
LFEILISPSSRSELATENILEQEAKCFTDGARKPEYSSVVETGGVQARRLRSYVVLMISS